MSKKENKKVNEENVDIKETVEEVKDSTETDVKDEEVVEDTTKTDIGDAKTDVEDEEVVEDTTKTENKEKTVKNKTSKDKKNKSKDSTSKENIEKDTEDVGAKKARITIFAGIGVIVLLILIVLISNLKKTPTAEELIRGINTNFTYSDIDMNIGFNVNTTSDMGNITMNMVTNTQVISDKDTQYIKGDINTTLFGITGDVAVESWSDDLNTYTLNNETGVWEVSMNQSGMIDIHTVLDSITVEMFESYQLEEVERQDKEYAITGKLSNEKFFEMLNKLTTINTTVMAYDLDSTNELFPEDAEYEFMLVFDRKTDKLKAIQFFMGKETDEVSMKFIVIINELNNEKTIDIPKEVKENSAFAQEETEEPATEEVVEQEKPIKTLAQSLFDTNFVDEDMLVEKAGGGITKGSNLCSNVQTIINTYTEDEYLVLASTWGRLDEDLKQAIAFIYYKQWVDTAKFEELNIDTNELTYYYNMSE